MPAFKTVMVRECQVTVNKVQYEAADHVADRLMFLRNERKVTVAYDPLDPSAVAVLTDDDRLLTMLKPKRLVRMAPDDTETRRQVAEIAQRRSRLVRDARETVAGVRRAGHEIGVLQPLQLLAASANASSDFPAAPITPRKPQPAGDAQPAPLSTNQIAERMRLRLAK